MLTLTPLTVCHSLMEDFEDNVYVDDCVALCDSRPLALLSRF